MTDKTEHQTRVEELTDRGYSPGEAVGRAMAEEAGYTPLPAHGVDDPGTVGFDRPGAKRDA
jgi:hypothetical protein